MGFDYIGTMLLGTPTYAWALIPALGCAFIADKYHGMRAPMVMFNSVCIVIGTAMYSKLDMSHKTARYVGVFIAVGGGNGKHI
jgi:sugar phosphate permease